MFLAKTTTVGIETTATVLVVSIIASVVVTVPMAQMVATIITEIYVTIMIETQEVVRTKITVATTQKEVREETTTLATIMIEDREGITTLLMITTEVRGVESTIVEITSQHHQHRSVLQEEMTHQAVQAQARIDRIIMVEEVAWTIVVTNAISQAQVEIYLLAANAEAVVERQAQHQLVANAQRHQTKADRAEKLKELKVAEVEEINYQSTVGSL